MDYNQYFKNKKITVQGLGLLGRGVGDIEFLAKNGADLIVTDLKKAHELESSLSRLKQFSNIVYRLGEHNLEDFKNRDMILRAPNAPLDSIYLEEARKNNIPIEMSASLFAHLSNLPVIGITGTRGKTTTTYLIHYILKKAGKKVLLGGNILGVSNLSLLDEVSDSDILVLELDSWQLQGFGESKLSPHIAVFTNFMVDHLNYYKGDMNRYFFDKANIFKYQTVKDYLVVGKDISQKIPADVDSKLLVAGEQTKDWPAKLLGEHNREYIELAVLATSFVGVDEDIQKKAVAEFNGVPGRLEFVTEKEGISFYNDTTATIPDATLVALEALKNKGEIILISGGTDKELDYVEYGKIVPTLTKQIILLPGTATEKIKKSFSETVSYIEVSSMSEAVLKARESAQSGSIILLSPGAASFGPPPGGFKNEYDRGEQFVNLVNK